MFRSPTVLGAMLMAFAAACIAVDTMIIRVVSQEIHPFEIAFFRNFFSLVAVAPWLWRVGRVGLKTGRMPLHIGRALLKLAGLICFFYAVKTMPLATVTAIAFTTPLFVTIGSMVFLGEPPLRRRMLALAAGFIGVLIVIRPGATPVDAAVLLAILSALCLGGVGLLMKYLSVREHPPAVVSLNLLLTTPAALLLMLPVWTMPSPHILGLMMVQGLIGGMSQLCVSRAMSMADASILAPMDFLKLPLVVALAWLIFSEPSDWWTLVGGTVIFAATIAIVTLERRSYGPDIARILK